MKGATNKLDNPPGPIIAARGRTTKECSTTKTTKSSHLNTQENLTKDATHPCLKSPPAVDSSRDLKNPTSTANILQGDTPISEPSSTFTLQQQQQANKMQGSSQASNGQEASHVERQENGSSKSRPQLSSGPGQDHFRPPDHPRFRAFVSPQESRPPTSAPSSTMNNMGYEDITERKRPPPPERPESERKRTSPDYSSSDNQSESKPAAVQSTRTFNVPVACDASPRGDLSNDSPSRRRAAAPSFIAPPFAKTECDGSEDYYLHISVTAAGLHLCVRQDDKGRACFESLDRKLDAGSPVIPRSGDEILEIDGKSMHSFDFDTVSKALKDHEGRPQRTIRLRIDKFRSIPMPMPKDFVNGVARLGKKEEHALYVIPPPDNRQEEVDMCREINDIYSRCSIHEKLREHGLRGKDNSIRSIQSRRFEVFIRDASNKGSTFWDNMLLEHKKKKRRRRGSLQLPDNATDRILDYAVEQARKDPRIRNSKNQFKFGNFSLILSYGGVPAQAPHVDLLAPNYQFVLCLTDQSTSTNFYDLEEEDRIRSVQDLQRLWNSFEEKHETPFSSNLATILESCPDFKTLLHDFGDVLHPNSTFRKIEKRIDKVPVGTVLSLPGSVVHAGPATDGFRAVLFFSAVPICDESPVAVEYNPDTQFSSVLLAGFILLLSWRKIGMTTEDRLYLLRRLAMYVRQADVKKGWDRHFHHEASLRETVKKMANITNPKTLDAFLRKQAATEALVFYHVQTYEFNGDFSCVSDARLHTMWEGTAYKVAVFKRSVDNKALLFYPADQSPYDVSLGWEGQKPGEHYTLQMTSENEVFNGKNGTLRDADGEKIICYISNKAIGAATTG